MSRRDETPGVQLWTPDDEENVATMSVVRTRPMRVIVTPVEAPLIHPLSKRDVQLVMSMLPPSSTEGLRSVSLLGERTRPNGWPIFASYRRLGFVRLHAVSSLPWQVPVLPLPAAAELRLYGARVENRPGGARITWLGDSLHIFYVLGVLLPGVARHRREREGQIEADSLIRFLADRDDPWWATDAAVSEWRQLLSRDGGGPEAAGTRASGASARSAAASDGFDSPEVRS